MWCGTRRTVCFGEARFSAGLEFDGKFGLSQLVTIKNQLVMAFSGIEVGISELYRAVNIKGSERFSEINHIPLYG